jgi:hypothetical protein
MKPINKKANIFLESSTILIILAIFGLCSIITVFLLGAVNDKWQAQDMPNGNSSKEAMNTINTKAPSILDGGFAILLGGLWIGAIIAALYINTHPAYFYTIIMLLGILVLFTYIIGLFVNAIGSTDTFSDSYNSLPIIKWVFQHTWETLTMIAITIGIVLFGKGQVVQAYE